MLELLCCCCSSIVSAWSCFDVVGVVAIVITVVVWSCVVFATEVLSMFGAALLLCLLLLLQ